MTHRFAELMFTPAVQAWQQAEGSRESYARVAQPRFPARDRLTQGEIDHISTRDSFYTASVSETGWPYVQHRGGRPGFLKIIDDRTLAFAEYPGNQQYVTFGNLGGDDRVSLFLMDYPKRRRLKILAHARVIDLDHDAGSLQQISEDGETPRRGVILVLEGFDWNCPKYITPRFTLAELAPLQARLEALEAENTALRARLASAGRS